MRQLAPEPRQSTCPSRVLRSQRFTKHIADEALEPKWLRNNCPQPDLPCESIFFGAFDLPLLNFNRRTHLLNLVKKLVTRVFCLRSSFGGCISSSGYQSLSLPRVVLTPMSKNGRQDPPNPDERKNTDHQSEERLYRETCHLLLEDTRREQPRESQRYQYTETCRGNVDYRIPDIPLSTVHQVDKNRKES